MVAPPLDWIERCWVECCVECWVRYLDTGLDARPCADIPAKSTVFGAPPLYTWSMSNTESYTSEELLAMWQSFQMNQQPMCPVCDAPVEIELTGDPAESGAETAEIQAHCTGCGRGGHDKPGEHSDVQAWLD